ncbi:MAG TPA: UDP-N-acetylmuramoyl-L-alanine--D-glutamate ligase [Caulobacterales bacterium]|jgi:UDP-N-acetylmuramoylalanine--D-glutamate ligase|nr:UDP-N-acetylmuramoyl-L-alanine--D-glutamate ligase [Caulobacterales bacterium]
MIPISEYAGRDVAIFGLARSGVASAKALLAGGARVHAWDENEAARARAAGEGVPLVDINRNDWRGYSALVLSPGVPLTHPRPHRIVELAQAVGVPIVGDIELYAGAVNALAPHLRPRTIGVTGTNGKSTTTALIGHILSACGKDARVGGNIGTSVLDLPPLHAGAYYVIELSSYQLDLTHSLRCDAAVLLNITPDHLDRHGGMGGYIAAKKRIFLNQGAGDWAIVGVDTPETAEICSELTRLNARTVAPISNAQAVGRGVSALGGALYDSLGGRAQMVMDLAAAPALPGKHNAQNIAAAYAAARAMGLETRAIAGAIQSFPGLAHRLESVGDVEGVRFINDSKATNADAAAQALACYPRVRWILGGVAKEGGIDSLADFFPRIARAYVIGEAGPSFASVLNRADVPVTPATTMERAVRLAFEDALQSGRTDEIVLLAPACASFDQYADFERRGEDFKACVRALRAPAALDARSGERP